MKELERLNKEIDLILRIMAVTPKDSDDYANMVSILNRLLRAKSEKENLNAGPDKIALLAHLLVIRSIIKGERA